MDQIGATTSRYCIFFCFSEGLHHIDKERLVLLAGLADIAVGLHQICHDLQLRTFTLESKDLIWLFLRRRLVLLNVVFDDAAFLSETAQKIVNVDSL